jgi:very-short-patch-repair endonuclease
MPREFDTADWRIDRYAAKQHGIVTTRQLQAAGLSSASISERCRAGRLHRVYRGVYAVGHSAISREGHWMAAVMACGEGAVLSHGSAAVLWELVRPFGEPIHVSVSSTAGRAPRRGLRIHRCPSLGVSSSLGSAEETRHGPLRTVRFGIPVTSVPRTIADLREGDYEDWWVRKAIRQAEFRKYRVGIRTDRSRSDLERDFLAFFRRQRFPKPEVNVKVDKWTVDFLWRKARVAVETDFFDYHRGSVAFEEDHERDLGLRGLRFTVLRYTGDLLDSQPDEIAAELGEALRVGAAWQPTRPSSS